MKSARECCVFLVKVFKILFSIRKYLCLVINSERFLFATGESFHETVQISCVCAFSVGLHVTILNV